MNNSELRLIVLGVRGSIPVSGKKYNEYGCATTCFQIDAGDQVIFIDSGTGIVNAEDIDDSKNISILFSHPHLDHIIGLPFFPELSHKGRRITIYGRQLEGMNIKKQIDKIFSEPYWPLMTEEYPSELIINNLELPLILNDVVIEGKNVRHPGGNIAFKISYKGKQIVCLTDYEHGYSEDGTFADKDVISYCEGADLVLYDAQYTDEEYSIKKGYGHSTWKEGVKLKESAGIKQMLLIHHDPEHDDVFLRNQENLIQDKAIRFAREGEEIIIR